MAAIEFTSHLEIKRILWIDDLFVKNNESLIKLLIDNSIHIPNLKTSELQALGKTEEFINRKEFSDRFKAALIAIIENFDVQKTQEAFEDLLKVLANSDVGHEDLSLNAISEIVTELGEATVEKLSFSDAFNILGSEEELNDVNTLYLIDKDNKYDQHPEFVSGVHVIKYLITKNSQGKHVLFSHNFNPDQEATHELSLISQVKAEQNKILPIAAISKLQLNDEATRKEKLCAALKRITVRFLIDELACSLKDEIKNGFDKAIYSLNEVPTAQLDKYLIKSATAEGISEAHVLERIISASMKESIKNKLTDNHNQQRLQILRKIKLDNIDETEADSKLTAFFEAEVYEQENLLNSTYSPIACGDIFQAQSEHADQQHRYILISPPCDTVLRGGSGSSLGKRNASIGFLVSIVEATNLNTSVSPKSYKVPVKFSNKEWNVNFNCMASINLSVLDWCSFNSEGIVKNQASLDTSHHMLPGVEKRYKDSAKLIQSYFEEFEKVKTNLPKNPELLSTFSRNDKFHKEFQLMHSSGGLNCPKLNYINKAVFSDAQKEIQFPLKRIGRLKSPYAESILRRLSEILSRSVYELHYLDTRA